MNFAQTMCPKPISETPPEDLQQIIDHQLALRNQRNKQYRTLHETYSLLKNDLDKIEYLESYKPQHFDLSKYKANQRTFPANLNMHQQEDRPQIVQIGLKSNRNKKPNVLLQDDKLWFQGEAISRIKEQTQEMRTEQMSQTIQFFHEHEANMNKQKILLKDEQLDKLNRDTIKGYFGTLPQSFRNTINLQDFEDQQDSTNKNHYSTFAGLQSFKKKNSLTLDLREPKLKINPKYQSQTSRNDFINLQEQNTTSYRRFQDLSYNISNEIEDSRFLPPGNNNFYFIQKSDLPQFQTYNLNLIKTSERSKLKIFFSNSRNKNKNYQVVDQLESFKEKFLSPIAKSSQISNASSRIRKVIDIKKDLQSQKGTLNNSSQFIPQIKTWRKQVKHLRPIYKKPEDVDDILNKSESKNNTSNFTFIDITEQNANSQNQSQNQIGYYKTISTINQEINKKKRIKSLIEKRRQSQEKEDNDKDPLLKRREEEESLLRMTEDYLRDLDEHQNLIDIKIQKLKNPQQIDRSLLEKIQNIKHFQGFTPKSHQLNNNSTTTKQQLAPFKPLNYGDKLVLYGLLDKTNESEDMQKIKEAIKARQAQQIQEKIKGGFMKLLMENGKKPTSFINHVNSQSRGSISISPRQETNEPIPKSGLNIGFIKALQNQAKKQNTSANQTILDNKIELFQNKPK